MEYRVPVYIAGTCPLKRGVCISEIQNSMFHFIRIKSAYLSKSSQLLWLGAAVNQEGKIVTHPLDKKVIGDFGEPLSSLLQADRSHVEYCLTQVTKIAGEMKRRRREVEGG